MKKGKEILNSKFSTDTSEKRIDLLTGVVLFAFGLYHSILYFGHTTVPNGDFPDFFRLGRELLSLQMPASFKHAPVLGLLQNLLYYVVWGQHRDLTAGWLLNAILHPFNVVLLRMVGKRILGKAALWFALIAVINPWTIYLLTEPIIETPFLFFILLTFYLIFNRSRWAYLAAAVTTMVRYEGSALILACFVADIIHRKNRRDVIRALAFSLAASVPLAVWMLLTVLTWKEGTTHYLSVMFSKEYSKGFVEPAENRTGLVLHLNLLWQVAFQPLLMPYPGASNDFADMVWKLSKTFAFIGFAFGSVYGLCNRRWEILMLLLFFVPYFLLHAYYPYPLTRFHSSILWIALLICLFGWQSGWQLLDHKQRVPRLVVITLQALLTIAAIAWATAIVPYLPKISQASPVSTSMPYVAALLVAAFAAARLYIYKIKYIPKELCTLAVLCLVIASNQFILARLLGNGQREIEFKLLGEWFAANAKPDEKLVVYMDGPTRLFAGSSAGNIIGFPKAASPEELVEKLLEQGATYVVWATREGFSKGQHTGYQQLGLNKNIAFLSEPKSIGPYQFVTQLGSNRGFVNVFRLQKAAGPAGDSAGRSGAPAKSD